MSLQCYVFLDLKKIEYGASQEFRPAKQQQESNESASPQDVQRYIITYSGLQGRPNNAASPATKPNPNNLHHDPPDKFF